MDALLGLGGAIVGGLLVLLGDAARRRAQRRDENVLKLSEASVAYAVVIGRLFARARDSFERGETPTVERPERYEASLRFFMTPGSEELYPTAMKVVAAYLAYARTDPSADDARAAANRYFVEQREFEAQMRAIVRRGAIGKATETQRVSVTNW
jgi:hypothetical protein